MKSNTGIIILVLVGSLLWLGTYYDTDLIITPTVEESAPLPTVNNTGTGKALEIGFDDRGVTSIHTGIAVTLDETNSQKFTIHGHPSCVFEIQTYRAVDGKWVKDIYEILGGESIVLTREELNRAVVTRKSSHPRDIHIGDATLTIRPVINARIEVKK